MKIDDLQKHISQYVFTHTNMNAIKSVLSSDYATENTERLEIYRNNTLHSLSEAIIDLYPSIENVVGKDFLIATAKEYLKVSPPNSAALLDFALDFPDFLESFEHTKNYTYLPDLARIDVLRHQAYHAEDETALSAEQIQSISLDQLAASRIELPNSCHLIKSLFKCYSLWENIANGVDSEISINGTEHILIYRDNLLVKTKSLDASEYYFITQIHNRNPLGDSLEYTLKQFPDCNTALLFSLLITNKLIISLS